MDVGPDPDSGEGLPDCGEANVRPSGRLRLSVGQDEGSTPGVTDTSVELTSGKTAS